MPMYLTRFSYTPEAWARLAKNPEDRRNAAKAYIESVGGKTEAWYFSYGVEDVVVIIDAEPAAAVALSMAVNQSGAVRLNTTPLLTSAEMDAARSQVPQFRAPGAG